MPWGNEEDVEQIVRHLMRPIRAKHKKEIERLKAKIEKLEQALSEARAIASYHEFPDTTGGQNLAYTSGTGEMGQ